MYHNPILIYQKERSRLIVTKQFCLIKQQKILKTSMEKSVDIICAVSNLNNYAEKRGKRNFVIFVSIDLKREIKADIVFVAKTKTHILNVQQNRRLFD